MDTFMDKLAHKLTAQEMIKANTAADTEEMNRLKAQVKEYNDCLQEMKLVCHELQTYSQELRALNTQMDGVFDEAIRPQVDRLVSESMRKLQEFQAATPDNSDLKQFVEEKITASSENVHKECVKVYRNVQAVVVEEGNKQTEAVNVAIARVKGKLSAVLGISIAALIAALGSIAFQVLTYLNIL